MFHASLLIRDADFAVEVCDGAVLAMAPVSDTSRYAPRGQSEDSRGAAYRLGQRALRQLRRFVADPSRSFDLPLSLHGTPLHVAVWRALMDIPMGETRTYTQLAETVRHPQACRAVAQACAHNRLAYAVPCHRAIRRDGSLGGFRWGLAQKRALLEREARARQRSLG